MSSGTPACNSANSKASGKPMVRTAIFKQIVRVLDSKISWMKWETRQREARLEKPSRDLKTARRSSGGRLESRGDDMVEEADDLSGGRLWKEKCIEFFALLAKCTCKVCGR